MMNAVMMSKQKAINHYIEECAKLKQELETEKIENERIRRLLMSYSSSDYLIDRIYPTVAGFEAFQDKKSEDTDTGKKQSANYNKCPPPIWEGYSLRKPNSELVKKAVNIKLKSETTDELPDNIDITFTSSDTDHESELIKKVVDQVLDKDEESESKSESGQVLNKRKRAHSGSNRTMCFLQKNRNMRRMKLIRKRRQEPVTDAKNLVISPGTVQREPTHNRECLLNSKKKLLIKLNHQLKN
ncbi:hypothetical protein HanPI659440_Chr04g0167511 [Helianthus annuus]|nr:hypothetical protein HanPI659440_Chr04g0167511 [Helianthus annuus]